MNNKPCPFCGGHPHEWIDDGGSPEGYATISCEDGCGETLMSRKLRSTFAIDPETKEDTWRILREKWNTRPEDSLRESVRRLVGEWRETASTSADLHAWLYLAANELSALIDRKDGGE